MVTFTDITCLILSVRSMTSGQPMSVLRHPAAAPNLRSTNVHPGRALVRRDPERHNRAGRLWPTGCAGSPAIYAPKPKHPPDGRSAVEHTDSGVAFSPGPRTASGEVSRLRCWSGAADAVVAAIIRSVMLAVEICKNAATSPKAQPFG